MKIKKITSALLAVLMLLSICTVGSTAAAEAEIPFTDVKKNWSYEPIKYVYETGLMNGTGDGTKFSPDGKLTRAMVVTVLYRNDGSPLDVYRNPFCDLAEGKYYTKAALWAYKNGIVTGTGENEWGEPYFSADRNITRQELAAMFARYAAYRHVDTNKKTADIGGFPDVGSVAKWATDAVKWTVGTGIITGKVGGGKTTLSPKDEATRAEYATIIQRYNTKDASREFEYNLFYSNPFPTSTYKEREYPLVGDADFYVAVDGNDKNEGTMEKPLATFAGAKAKVREKLAAGAKGEIKVAFMAGVYEAPLDLTFTEEDSGNKDVTVTYCAYGDGKVTFNAGITLPLEKFTKISDAEREMFADSVENKIKKIDLNEFGIDPKKLGEANNLFSGRDRLIIARWPNRSQTGADLFNRDYESVPKDESHIVLKKNLADRLNTYHNIDDLYMLGYYRYDWSASDGKVISYDPETRQIVPFVNGYGIYSSQADWNSGLPYFFFYNIPDELDVSDEYYIDKKTGILYVLDPKNDFTLSHTGQMITINGADHISFVNLEFCYGASGWINAPDADSITVDRCKVHNMREKGIYIIGDNNVVSSCEFYDVGMRNVEMISGDRETLTHGNSVIENCLFDNFGKVVKTGQPAIYVWGCGIRIANNEICNSTNIGIMYSEYIWASNYITIEYNYIHNVLTQTSDSGAIYAGRNGAGHGTVVRYNIIDTTGDPDRGHNAVGIYLDDIMSGQEIYGNIIYGVSADYIFVNGGRENKIHDNIFIVPEYYDRGMIQINQNQYVKVKEQLTENFTKPMTDWEELMIVELVPFRNELWSSRFPTLAKLTYGENMAQYENDINCLMNPSYNVVKDNVIFTTQAILDKVSVEDRERYAERVVMFSELEPCINRSFDTNPYFTDPTHGDYSFTGKADVADNHFDKIGRY